MAVNLFYATGQRRLSLIHDRVRYLRTEYDDHPGESSRREDLCGFCQDNFLQRHATSGPLIDIRNTAQDSLFISCTGSKWVCRSKASLIGLQNVGFRNDDLMSKSSYAQLMWDLVYSLEPKDAMYSISHFNYELKKNQPHLNNMLNVAELILWRHFEPFTLKHEIFPVPPLGLELVDRYVAPLQIEQYREVPLRRAQWRSTLTAPMRGSQLMDSHEPEDDDVLGPCIRSGCLRERGEDRTLLCMIDEICSARDPCGHCRVQKIMHPTQKVDCMGLKALCRTRSQFFNEFPSRYSSLYEFTCSLVRCRTAEEYGHLLDQIFDMTFVERAMELKCAVDRELLSVHPHLGRVIGLYDALLLRYYNPEGAMKEGLPEPDTIYCSHGMTTTVRARNPQEKVKASFGGSSMSEMAREVYDALECSSDEELSIAMT